MMVMMVMMMTRQALQQHNRIVFVTIKSMLSFTLCQEGNHLTVTVCQS